MKLVVAMLLVAAAAACAARLWLGPIVIDEYANVKVRVYHAGLQCRIEIQTATDVIQTPITRCVVMPQRAKTNE